MESGIERLNGGCFFMVIHSCEAAERSRHPIVRNDGRNPTLGAERALAPVGVGRECGLLAERRCGFNKSSSIWAIRATLDTKNAMNARAVCVKGRITHVLRRTGRDGFARLRGLTARATTCSE